MAHDNPPAFPFQPVTVDGQPDSPEYGMSLRDWFAGQALVACGEPYGGRSDDTHARRNVLFREHAKRLYAIADAMLAQRAEASNG